MSDETDAGKPAIADAPAPLTPAFTPGPWTLETVRTSCGICHKVGPFPGHHSMEVGHACIYVDYPGAGKRESELRANARLISAAPEMFEALMGVVAVADRETVEFIRARAAIAKATGAT